MQAAVSQKQRVISEKHAGIVQKQTMVSIMQPGIAE
jgi:hypothetical protein